MGACAREASVREGGGGRGNENLAQHLVSDTCVLLLGGNLSFPAPHARKLAIHRRNR